MILTSYSLVLVTFLVAAGLPSSSQLVAGPLSVLLSLTDDLTSIKANVTNLGVEVNEILPFNFLMLIFHSSKST
jgi:hypothetical protein